MSIEKTKKVKKSSKKLRFKTKVGLAAAAVSTVAVGATAAAVLTHENKALTTKAERAIKMPALREVKKIEKICFPLLQSSAMDALQAGLDSTQFSVHKLRHTAATMMLSAGVDVKTVQEVLGHENLNTTQIYTHIENTELKIAAEANPLSKLDFSDKE